MRRELVVVDAPSNLGLRPAAPGAIPGVYRMPDALRATGLPGRLGAADGGRLAPPACSPEPDFETGHLNGPALRSDSVALAERTGRRRPRAHHPRPGPGPGRRLRALSRR
ncbi:MAG TPA: hypothetical protein VEL05_05740 [Candidatus Acidoferrum sp.]|nr:hypothetical protein [Candidatus Acidoferrum sp.]